MAGLIAKIEFTNSKSVPHVVHVEPWGADYTLLPNESIKLVVYGGTKSPWFDLIEHSGETQAYCEEANTFEVFQGETLLICGHNRQTSNGA